jgi:branched-subunit amino acid aminotransferase/4-amino-4-deoxychorismate lyase
MVQTIHTTEESMKIYLENQIFHTRGHIIRINNNLNVLQKDYQESAQNVKSEWARLIDDSRLELENYEFRLDWLQTRLEELQALINL